MKQQFSTGPFDRTVTLPDGQRADLFLDTSWDGRGTHVAIIEGRWRRLIPGSPATLGVIEAEEDDVVATGSDVYEMYAYPAA